MRPYRGVGAEDRKAERRARLIEAGREQFGTRGIAGVGVGDVCVEAGLTKRYFYEHFASIAELVDAVIDDALSHLAQRIIDSVPRGARGSTRRSLEAFIGALVEDPRLIRLLVVESYSGSLVDHRRRFVEQTISVLFDSDRLRDDSARPVGSRAAAYALTGAAGEILVAWHDGRLKMSRSALVDAVIDLARRLDGFATTTTTTRAPRATPEHNERR